MKCYSCGKTDVSLYRTGPKGPGCDPKWMCEVCMPGKPDPEVKKIVDTINKDNKKGRKKK